MKHQEINKIIQQSNDPSWFKDQKYTFQFTGGLAYEKEGVSSIFKFIELQISLWDKIDKIPDEFLESYQVLKNTMNAIEVVFNNHKEWSPNQVENHWNNQVIRYLNQNTPKLVDISSPTVQFLLEVYKDHPENFKGAHAVLFNVQLSEVNNPAFMEGVLMGFEYRNQDFNQRKQRRTAEKRSLEQLRAAMSKQFDELQVNFKEKSEALDEVYKAQLDDSIQNEEELKLKFQTWFKESVEKESTFSTTSTTNIKKLEEAYGEKLKFSKPAEQWSMRANQLKISSRWYIGGLTFSILFTVTILVLILSLISTDTLVIVFSDLATSIKWSIVFVLIVSFSAFFIRLFSKLLFSTMHLKRDAEEREQLMYVYLALVKEKDILPEERHLVMQSLFSRSDSGLLKEDSSPTMPGAGAVLEKIFKS
jgi:hypothetical protein